MIVETDFLDHWKTQLLRDRLGGDIAVIAVLRLWTHCQLRKTHRFTLSPDALKAVCRWPGPAHVLLDALLEAGFLDRGDAEGSYVVHDWDKTNVYLVQAWENGAKGGRPKASTTSGKPTANRTETGRLSSGSPDGNRTPTGTEPIDIRGGKGREGNGREEPSHTPKELPPGPFPTDGIPYLVASELRKLCPDLRDKATPDAIANGPYLTSRFQHMPLEEWLHATQEFAGFLNSGGELKPGKTWLNTLSSYIGTRHTAWSRDRAFAERTSSREATGYPPKNNFGPPAPSSDPLWNPVVGT